MTTVTLRSLGGSVVMTVPKKILSMIHLHVGAAVDLSVQGGKLVVSPRTVPRYRLSELIARSDEASWSLADEDRAWLRSKPVGGEVL